MQTTSHKVIITGTGRAGTTFLVRLFTELGLDAGYSRDNWQRDYFAHCNAGLEHELSDPQAPYIVKNPGICESLESDLVNSRVKIDLAIIPVRELDAAASSRIRIGGANGGVPGGLLGTGDPAQQRAILAEMFHRLVYTLVSHDIPYTFLLFPRFVQDSAYAYERLKPLLAEIDQAEFEAAFLRVAEPKLVHTFAAGANVASTDLSGYQAAQRHKRKVRRLRRYATWSAMAACLALAIGSRWPASAMGNPRVRSTPSVALAAPAAPTLAAQVALPDSLVGPERMSTLQFTFGGEELGGASRPRRSVRLSPLLSHLTVEHQASIFISPTGAPELSAGAGAGKLVTESPQ